MDSKTFRLSVAAVFTTVVLIAVVVYAANRDRINSMMGSGNAGDTETGEAMTDEEASVTDYGEQIGDNLKGFLTSDGCFDKSEQRPSVVVVVDNVPVPANASSSDDTTDITDMTDVTPTEQGISAGDEPEAEALGDDEKAKEGSSADKDEKDPPAKPDGETSSGEPDGENPPKKPDKDASSADPKDDATEDGTASYGSADESSSAALEGDSGAKASSDSSGN